ncbi:MAG: YgjV family protein [Candidatus Saccharibacteria bacterium]|nr:YgjV family protein [Candidatus Saccharibacteria bacterium]
MESDVITLILEQAFGIFALICTVVSMQLKKKRPLMIMQTSSEAFIVAQYLVKGAITGSLMAVVSFVRDVIFTKYETQRAPIWILLVLYAVMIGLTVLSWAGTISILPFVGSIIYAFALWYGEVKWIRLGNALGNTPYIIYTLLTGNYALFVMTVIEVASAAIGFLRIDVMKKTPRR